jgi:PIN domain nuclease of toxin-antitoxin system
VILLDTHIWYWYVSGSDRLQQPAAQRIEAERTGDGLRISIISCWEVLQKARAGKLGIQGDPVRWLGFALADPRLTVVGLTPQIVADAVLLPGDFHKDPADRFIVATARVLDCPLLTVDEKIVAYTHVKVVE